MLVEIRKIVEERLDISTKMTLCIKEKGEKERNRLNMLFQYGGTDAETLRVLHRSENLWWWDAAQFWEAPARFGHRLPNAQAQIVGYYLHGQDVDA